MAYMAWQGISPQPTHTNKKALFSRAFLLTLNKYSNDYLVVLVFVSVVVAVLVVGPFLAAS